jgi:dephospho-CoA kinase
VLCKRHPFRRWEAKLDRAVRSRDSDQPSAAPLHVFGLTGGIASGKSTVATHWRKRGLPVVDADLLARQAVAPGSACLAAIARRFGEHVLLEDGSLNRHELGAHVFDDPAALRELSALVHPRVKELAESEFEALGRGGSRLACYEVPLLFESGLDTRYRPVVVVAAPEQLQVSRLMQQRGLTQTQALDRLASQLPMGEKLRRADFVIDGSGEIEETRRQADLVLQRVASELGLTEAFS